MSFYVGTQLGTILVTGLRLPVVDTDVLVYGQDMLPTTVALSEMVIGGLSPERSIHTPGFLQPLEQFVRSADL
jgi:hypothetical protein